MSEQSLRNVLERLNTDDKFSKRMNEDPGAVIGEYALSPAETAALLSNDDDALARLAGAETSGFAVRRLAPRVSTESYATLTTLSYKSYIESTINPITMIEKDIQF